MPKPLWNDEQHQGFLGRLTGSSAAVFAFGLHLHRRDFRIEIAPVIRSPNAASNVNFVDSGDLFILTPGKRTRFEVKGIRTDFTCRKNWPYPHLFFSNAPAVKRANGKVFAYVVINRRLTHGALVRRTTHESWYEQPCIPSNTGIREVNCCCPLQLVEWFEL